MGRSFEPQPGILQIAPYVGGASTLAGHGEVLKLSSNENPFGPSDAARTAFARTAHMLHRYPSTDHAPLRAAIADEHGIDATRIVCGVGSDEIIHMLCQAYAGPGDEVLQTAHGFAMYRISALAAGATPVAVPERDRVVDVDAVLAACTPRTRLVFITNPGNPTGTLLTGAELARLADGLPAQAILVLDAAYCEYAEDFDGGLALSEARENIVVTRTFSKIYGLGGMRVGWGYAPAGIVEVLNRIRGPFNLSVPALAAAEAAVRDHAFLARCKSENARMRRWLTDALRGMGLACDESHANFVLARFAGADEAQACNAALQADGIIVRYVANYGIPEGLRITVGDESACRRVAHCIRAFKGVPA